VASTLSINLGTGHDRTSSLSQEVVRNKFTTGWRQAGGRLATGRVTAGKRLLATSLQQASDRQGHCRVRYKFTRRRDTGDRHERPKLKAEVPSRANEQLNLQHKLTFPSQSCNSNKLNKSRGKLDLTNKVCRLQVTAQDEQAKQKVKHQAEEAEGAKQAELTDSICRLQHFTTEQAHGRQEAVGDLSTTGR